MGCARSCPAQGDSSQGALQGHGLSPLHASRHGAGHSGDRSRHPSRSLSQPGERQGGCADAGPAVPSATGGRFAMCG